MTIMIWLSLVTVTLSYCQVYYSVSYHINKKLNFLQYRIELFLIFHPVSVILLKYLSIYEHVWEIVETNYELGTP